MEEAINSIDIKEELLESLGEDSPENNTGNLEYSVSESIVKEELDLDEEEIQRPDNISLHVKQEPEDVEEEEEIQAPHSVFLSPGVEPKVLEEEREEKDPLGPNDTASTRRHGSDISVADQRFCKMETSSDEFASEDIAERERKVCEKLPQKSKEKYRKQFLHFVKWRKEHGCHGVNKDILLSYFAALRKTVKPSSLWCKYSMLRCTLELHEKVDISKFGELCLYLRENSANYTPRRVKGLERQQIEKFLIDAPDDDYLLMKIVLLFGIYGSCCCEELTYITVDDVCDNDLYLCVTLTQMKSNKPRTFCVLRDNFPVDAVALYRKYLSKRPEKVEHRRLFLQYRKGICLTQPAGINKLSRIPKMVATYLNLDDLESYTGQSLRRSSKSLLVHGEGNLTCHTNWKSCTVAKGYVDVSTQTLLK